MPNTIPTLPPGMSECARCRKRWGGLRTCHCGGCHETFTSPSAFDLHRTGSHPDGRSCLEPAACGLLETSRAYPCWGYPGRDDAAPTKAELDAQTGGLHPSSMCGEDCSGCCDDWEWK